MQQELIEMLEKVVDHVVLCNEYDQRFSSTSYGVSLLKEAEALVEKAKNSAKEPAVPFDEQEAFEREMRSRHGWNNSYFTQSNDGGYLSNRATYAYIGWQARASIEKSAAKEPAVPQGWRKDLFTIVHAMGMNNWHWTSDASNDLKREAYSAAARLYNASAHATPAAPSQEPVPGQQPDTFRERNAQFREQNWQIRFDAAVEARRQAQEQLYSERERHNSEIQALRQEISRLLSSQQLRRLDAENQRLKTSLALVQQHNATAWNRGHRAGLRAGESAIKQATDAVKADAWGNTQLTNALMQAEAERDQLRAQLSKAVAEEREACALECESRQANGNRTHTHPDECAAAIRARSNT